MLIKDIHVTFVALTFLSFSSRIYWKYTNSAMLQNRVVKILPHIIDTILLLSGLAMAIMYYGAFYRRPWLMLKLACVVVYIILGIVALRSGKTRSVRVAAAIGAWLVFFYIIFIAWKNAVLPF